MLDLIKWLYDLTRRTAAQRTPWVQARRINCGCGADYVYLARGELRLQNLGLPFFSLFRSREGILRALQSKAFERLMRLEAAPRQGLGRCPHCRRYQWWMWLSRSGQTGALYGVIAGTILAILPGLALKRALPDLPQDVLNGLGCGSGALILALCGVIGYRLSVRGYVPRARRDPSSMTVEAWERARLEAERGGERVELRWLEELEESRLLVIARAINDSEAEAGPLRVLDPRV